MEIAPTNLEPIDRPAPDHAVVRSVLLAWYARQGRDLPWRRTTDPYHILVSEFMLQQTQVDRVIPKYHAFLEEFPSLAALAAAPTAAVIRAWAGLGYNRRAVSLQSVARQVVEAHGGAIPDDPVVLERLHGIGRYTAGAVACFGYRRDVAFLDTNIRRVLHRLYFGPEAPMPHATERQLWSLAAEALPPGHGYEWNQALMDLGAMICTATRPLCAACPLMNHCRAAPTFLRYGLPERTFRALREQGAAYRPSIPFKQTNRYFRGRIIDILRALAPGETIGLADLGPRIRDDYDVGHTTWLRDLLDALVRDGLISATTDPDHPRYSLPH